MLIAATRFSAGCHYISTMHATYARRSVLRVLPKSYKLGGVSSTPIFDHLGAASWHRGDASAIKFAGVIFGWFLVPWKVIFIFCSVIGLSIWLQRRKARKSAASRALDTELFDLPDTPRSSRSGESTLFDSRSHSELDAEIKALEK